MRRVLMFVNPLLIRSPARRGAVERIAALLRAQGCTVEIEETLSAHSAGQQARAAVEAGYDTFLVCGGDGTVFQVVQGVAGSEAALGVLPFGTGNVIVQNLRLPRNPLAAAKMLLNAPVRRVSLGKITLHPVGHREKRSWFFFIAAGMGVHAALMNLAPTGQGKRRGGRLAYFLGGARLLVKHPVQVFEMEATHLDGRVTRHEVCEAIATHVGEINRWRPGGDPFGDSLQVAWVPPTTRVGLAHASYHALARRDGRKWLEGWGHLPYPRYARVERLVCHGLRGSTYETPLLVEADGEVLGTSQAVMGMAKERLNLLWPEAEKNW